VHLEAGEPKRPGPGGRSGGATGQGPSRPVKRKETGRTNPDRALRDHLLELLRGGHAHVTLQDAIGDWPAALRGARPAGQPFTPWRLLEHVRISQWDIVGFAKSAEHVSPKWPAGYWPEQDAPPDAAAPCTSKLISSRNVLPPASRPKRRSTRVKTSRSRALVMPTYRRRRASWISASRFSVDSR